MARVDCAPLGPGDDLLPADTGSFAPPAVSRELDRLTDRLGSRFGMTRRDFLKSQMGLAVTFLALNSVFGQFFSVDPAEASQPGAAGERMRRLADQFIFDVQVHYVYDRYPTPEGLLSLRRAAREWDPEPEMGDPEFRDILFENFFREIFEESQTKAAVLSNAPNDDKQGWFLTNEQALSTRERVNARTGRRSLLAHALITPGQPGWMEDLDRALDWKPDAIKGYTLGDPGGGSAYPWRLDDEALVYPAYEKIRKAGIKNICIHKGLLPTGYKAFIPPEKAAYANVDDVGPAARDWPDLNFIIYHSAIETVIPRADDVAAFKKTGRIPWVSDLAEIPGKFGVGNVYSELGAVFAATAAAHPELCAGILGTLIRGMGTDHVCWGTDSVWFGSPRWQIEALRRFEIPESMRTQYGFQPLGTADGRVKRMILGENSARLYGIDPAAYRS